MIAHPLPAGFDTLAPFTSAWVFDTTEERINARAGMAMDDIRAFYDAMLDRAPDAIEYIDQFPLADLPADAATLAKLLFALGQAAIAVEIHGAARAPGTPWPNSIRLVQGTSPFG